MKPECEASGDKWVIVSRTDEKQGGAMREVDHWWTGMLWTNDAKRALKFDSETDVNEFIDRNRAMLED